MLIVSPSYILYQLGSVPWIARSSIQSLNLLGSAALSLCIISSIVRLPGSKFCLIFLRSSCKRSLSCCTALIWFWAYTVSVSYFEIDVLNLSISFSLLSSVFWRLLTFYKFFSFDSFLKNGCLISASKSFCSRSLSFWAWDNFALSS